MNMKKMLACRARGIGAATVAMAAVVCGPVAHAQTSDPTKPVSVIEAGGVGVSGGADKSAEFGGLPTANGGRGIGNLDIRGGGAYDSDDAMRYRFVGTDLGLDTRSAWLDAGTQGRFRLTIGFDQIRRNRSTSYQTPYLGAGSTTLTLPSTWVVPIIASSSATNNATTSTSLRGLVPSIGLANYIDTQTTSATLGSLIGPNAAQRAAVNAAAAADVPLFQNFDVHTTRTRLDAAVAFALGAQWGVDASFTPEHKEGTKLMGTVSRNTGGDMAAYIPDVVDTNTNQVNVNLNFRSKQSSLQVGYYGSYFRNNVTTMSWQNWATGPTSSGQRGTTNTMSSAPNNDFGQFSVTFGYAPSTTTKLTGHLAYGRNTQNDAFLVDAYTPVVPVASLNGLVVDTLANLKFTARPSKAFTFNAAYRYDNRDNRTSVNTYQYSDTGETPAASANFTGVLAQNANANRPYSRKLNNVSVDGDLALPMDSHVKVAYGFERNERGCTGTWIDCVDVPVTNEHTFRLDWRASAAGVVNARLGYEYDQRRATSYNENAFLALVPYANVVPVGQTISAYQALTQNNLTGFGPILGYNGGTFVNGTFFPNNSALANALYANNNRISEVPGMRRYYVADRNRSKLRSGLTWQASEALTLQATGDYTNDDYANTTYGLTRSRTWAATVDASYAVGDQVSLELFYTRENLNSVLAGYTYNANSNTANVNGLTRLSGNGCDSFTTIQQRNNGFKLDPCAPWNSDQVDAVNSFGFGIRGRHGKMDSSANVIVSSARSDNNVTGGNWANNPLALTNAPATTTAAFFIAATPLPTVSTDSTEVRLQSSFEVRKGQSLRVLYSFLKMSSADWMYDGLQFGSLSGVLPTNEQPFAYSTHVIGMSYVITF